MVKTILKSDTLTFSVEERLADNIPLNMAHQLVEVAQIAMKDFIAEDESTFAKMHFHFDELQELSADTTSQQLSDADAVSVVKKLLTIK